MTKLSLGRIFNFGLYDVGRGMYELICELYPICRSITGNGVRETLEIIKEHIPIETYEIPSGTQVFGWRIPKEWNIKSAYVKDSRGRKVIDLKNRIKEKPFIRSHQDL